MALIIWQDSYSVGVTLIDTDHKLLVSLINQLSEAIDSGQGRDVVGSVLNVLVEYTQSHFSREEMMMAKGQYPDLEAHHREHVKLTDQVRDIVARYHAGDAGALDQEVLDFLKNWLTGHILGVDHKYRPYVEGVTLTPEEVLGTMDLEGDDIDDPFAT